MGFEGPRKIPEAVIKAAMAESPEPLRELASRGGKAAAEKRKAQKAAEAERLRIEQERIAAEREVFAEQDQEVIERDAFRHAKELPSLDD